MRESGRKVVSHHTTRIKSFFSDLCVSVSEIPLTRNEVITGRFLRPVPPHIHVHRHNHRHNQPQYHSLQWFLDIHNISSTEYVCNVYPIGYTRHYLLRVRESISGQELESLQVGAGHPKSASATFLTPWKLRENRNRCWRMKSMLDMLLKTSHVYLVLMLIYQYTVLFTGKPQKRSYKVLQKRYTDIDAVGSGAISSPSSVSWSLDSPPI